MEMTRIDEIKSTMLSQVSNKLAKPKNDREENVKPKPKAKASTVHVDNEDDQSDDEDLTSPEKQKVNIAKMNSTHNIE